MGYYSDYEGSVSVSEKISDDAMEKINAWFDKRFGKYILTPDADPVFEVDGKYYRGDLFFDRFHSRLKPIYGNMKGYAFNNHLYEICEFLKSLNLYANGTFIRIGEEYGDREEINVVDNTVYTRQSRLVYGSQSVFAETEAEYEEKMSKWMDTFIRHK